MPATNISITGAYVGVRAAKTTGKHREAEHNASTYDSIGKEVIRLVGQGDVCQVKWYRLLYV